MGPNDDADVRLSEGDDFAIVDRKGAWIKRLSLDHKDILKESTDGKTTHGGACQLIPFAGRVRNASYSLDGAGYTLPRNDGENSIHGFVRNMHFDSGIREDGKSAAFHVLATEAGYPSELDVTITMGVERHRFAAAYVVRNAGDRRAPLVIGSHPYFLFIGKWRLSHSERLERLVLTGGYFPDGTVEQADFNASTDTGLMRFDDCFRGGGTLTLSDDEKDIVIRRNNMQYFLIYNGIYSEGRSVAIEPMTGAPDAFNNGMGLCLLDPGAVFRCSFEIGIRRG